MVFGASFCWFCCKCCILCMQLQPSNERFCVYVSTVRTFMCRFIYICTHTHSNKRSEITSYGNLVFHCVKTKKKKNIHRAFIDVWTRAARVCILQLEWVLKNSDVVLTTTRNRDRIRHFVIVCLGISFFVSFVIVSMCVHLKRTYSPCICVCTCSSVRAFSVLNVSSFLYHSRYNEKKNRKIHCRG